MAKYRNLNTAKKANTGEWVKKSWLGRFASVHFSPMANIVEGSKKLSAGLQGLGIAMAVIGAITSLASIIPYVNYYSVAALGDNGWATTATIVATALGSYSIDISAMVTVPFAINMLAAVLMASTVPNADDNAVTRWCKSYLGGWWAIVSFFIQAIMLRAQALMTLGMLSLAVLQLGTSLTFSWYGNAGFVQQATDGLRPKDGADDVLALENSRSRKVEEVDKKYENRINYLNAKLVEKDKKKNLVLAKQGHALVETAKKRAEQTASPQVAKTKNWAWLALQIENAAAEARIDSAKLFSDIKEKIASLEKERESEITQINSTYSIAASKKEADEKAEGEIYSNLRGGVSMWAQYLGAGASLIFLAVVILGAISKVVDFQRLNKLASVATTKNATKDTTNATQDDNDDDQDDNDQHRSESDITKTIRDNMANTKQAGRNHATIAGNIIAAYEEYWKMRKWFWKDSAGKSDAEAEEKADKESLAYIQGFVNKYGDVMAPQNLEAIKKGIETFK